MPSLERAMTALAALEPAEVHASLKKLGIWWWERGERRFALDRWKTADDLKRAIAEGDPWLAANAVRLVAELAPAEAASIASELVFARFDKSDLEELAGNQATQTLWSTAHHLPLTALFELEGRDRLSGVDVTKVYARIPEAARLPTLLSLLPRKLQSSEFSYRLREVLALETVCAPETIGALAEVVLDDRHPTQERAATWLYRGGSEPALRALAAYLERGGKKEIRPAAIGAAARLGPESATRLLSSLAGDPEADPFERATCFDSVEYAIGEKRFPEDDATWIRLGLAALREKNVLVREAARRMLGAMNKRAVNAAAGSESPTTKKTAKKTKGS